MSRQSEVLLGLNACERAIEEFGRTRLDLPKTIEEAESGAQSARDLVVSERQKIEEAERRRREKEAELQDSEARKLKLEGQTAVVKTNVEYTALLREIEGVEQKISAIEEEILLAMETIDEVGSRIGVVETEQKRVEERCMDRAAELRRQLAEVERELEDRSGEREVLIAALDETSRGLYQRVFGVKGSGTARVEGNGCAACHRAVPWEILNRVQAGEILACQTCRRLLVASADA